MSMKMKEGKVEFWENIAQIRFPEGMEAECAVCKKIELKILNQYYDDNNNVKAIDIKIGHRFAGKVYCKEHKEIKFFERRNDRANRTITSARCEEILSYLGQEIKPKYEPGIFSRAGAKALLSLSPGEIRLNSQAAQHATTMASAAGAPYAVALGQEMLARHPEFAKLPWGFGLAGYGVLRKVFEKGVMLGRTDTFYMSPEKRTVFNWLSMCDKSTTAVWLENNDFNVYFIKDVEGFGGKLISDRWCVGSWPQPNEVYCGQDTSE